MPGRPPDDHRFWSSVLRGTLSLRPNRIVHSWLGNSHGVAANDNFRGIEPRRCGLDQCWRVRQPLQTSGYEWREFAAAGGLVSCAVIAATHSRSRFVVPIASAHRTPIE